MTAPGASRSQAILRVPVDVVDMSLILHDGDRWDVTLFVPPGENLAHFLTEGCPFIPVVRDGEEIFVARDAIACFGVSTDRALRLDDGLPIEQQPARITLRSGAVVEGLLRWVSLDSGRRTSDGLNAAGCYLIVDGGAFTCLVMKAHVATVSEV